MLENDSNHDYHLHINSSETNNSHENRTNENVSSTIQETYQMHNFDRPCDSPQRLNLDSKVHQNTISENTLSNHLGCCRKVNKELLLDTEIHQNAISENTLSNNLGNCRQVNKEQIPSINKRLNHIPIVGLRRSKRLKFASLKLVKDFTSTHSPPRDLIAGASNYMFKVTANLKEALQSEKWCNAMREEYKVNWKQNLEFGFISSLNECCGMQVGIQA